MTSLCVCVCVHLRVHPRVAQLSALCQVISASFEFASSFRDQCLAYFAGGLHIHAAAMPEHSPTYS
ncbi:MAG TPA: hypothetical protein EYO59_09870 [Chromatiaceae bacterium]|nr:hypothetical protein [Chromatiaceae bacterium]